MSMCRVLSCSVGRGCLLWPVCSFGKTLLAFALLHSVLQGQICLLLQVSHDFLLLHSSPLWWKGHLFFFFLMLLLEDLVSLHKTDQLLSGIIDWGINLDYCDIERFPWKQTEIILSFFRPYPSTAFQTLLLNMMATPFLLRDTAHSSRYNGHLS